MASPAAMSFPLPPPMRRALDLAAEAAAAGEVPVGAVVTLGEKIVAETRNAMRGSSDPTAHAEMEHSRRRRPARHVAARRLHLVGHARAVRDVRRRDRARAVQGAALRRGGPKGGGVVHGARIFAQPTCHHRPDVLGGIGEDGIGRAPAPLFRRTALGGWSNRTSIAHSGMLSAVRARLPAPVAARGGSRPDAGAQGVVGPAGLPPTSSKSHPAFDPRTGDLWFESAHPAIPRLAPQGQPLHPVRLEHRQRRADRRRWGRGQSMVQPRRPRCVVHFHPDQRRREGARARHLARDPRPGRALGAPQRLPEPINSAGNE